ncbi:MAG: FHA domain-containing protein [Clostridium sp.]|nr:FHA domain-containing protein [Clostridium sp.]MCM1173199.1 FHA domain-containing protein [Clostridium sp.]MCM1208314.1 FHA domain-containing protein [Ruminococcus sp.]
MLNELILNNVIYDVSNEHYIGYLLGDNSFFYNTMYQIIQKDVSGDFVKCYKSLQNGHIKLIYDIEGYRLFSSIANVIEENSFFQLIYKLILSLEKIKRNGFISLDAVASSVNRIFIDTKTLSIKFICIPLSTNTVWKEQNLYECGLLNVIADIIAESVYIGNYYMLQLMEDCRSGQFLLDDICNFMYSGKYGDWQTIIGNSYVNDTLDIHAIRLCGEEESYGSEIIINKSNFIIGKDAAQCSYAISASNNVSRKHCVISEEYDKWYIEDLESTNGTYLNDVRIRSGQRMPIKSGDKIVIADRHYIVGDCVNSVDEDKFKIGLMQG